MTCSDCSLSAKGHPGIDCPMLKIGIAKTFSGGCNLAQVRQEAKQAEKRRVEALPDVPMYAKKERLEERDLQSQCEGWLSNRGYRRMTAPEASRAATERLKDQMGWFFHLCKPIGNPLCPDLIVFNSDMTRCLCVELKVRNTFQDGQKEMIDLKCWRLAYTFKEVEDVVKDWEESN